MGRRKSLSDICDEHIELEVIKMKEKYKRCGLNYDLIVEKYPNIDEYEHIVNTYLEDEFFNEMKTMIIDEDHEMLKDACKGLYILANDLYLFPLYESLLDLYESVEYEEYSRLMEEYDEVMKRHQRIRNIFVV